MGVQLVVEMSALFRRLRPDMRLKLAGGERSNGPECTETTFALFVSLRRSPSGASLAHAQSADASYSGRALERLVQRLRADQTLPVSLRRLTAADLVGPTNSSYVRFFDDSGASEFVHLMAGTLHQVPDSVCGRFLQGAGHRPDLGAMLAYVDSSTTDRWVAMLERLVRARARPTPGCRVATDPEVQAAYAAIPGRLSAADRQRMIWIARNPPPTPTTPSMATRERVDGAAHPRPPALG